MAGNRTRQSEKGLALHGHIARLTAACGCGGCRLLLAGEEVFQGHLVARSPCRSLASQQQASSCAVSWRARRQRSLCINCKRARNRRSRVPVSIFPATPTARPGVGSAERAHARNKQGGDPNRSARMLGQVSRVLAASMLTQFLVGTESSPHFRWHDLLTPATRLTSHSRRFCAARPKT